MHCMYIHLGFCDVCDCMTHMYIYIHIYIYHPPGVCDLPLALQTTQVEHAICTLGFSMATLVLSPFPHRSTSPLAPSRRGPRSPRNPRTPRGGKGFELGISAVRNMEQEQPSGWLRAPAQNMVLVGKGWK